MCTDDGNHCKFNLVCSCTLFYIYAFSFIIVLCTVDIRLLCIRCEENLIIFYFKNVNYLLILSLKMLLNSCNYWEKIFSIHVATNHQSFSILDGDTESSK